MLRAVVRAALLALLALSTTPALAQAPPATWTSLIPAGRYRTLAWHAGPQFVYLLQPVSRAPGRARLFVADVADLGVRERDDLLADIAARHAASIASHDVRVEPIAGARDVVGYVIRHRDVTELATLDGRDNLTLYVRGPAHTETGGGGGAGGGGM